ncbi:MAG: site-specific integrase [Coriobacteriales bacterium]|jgi:site-specific recombinase XerD|nr:site-specific integrase [Coriobacteriales bacterium]
MTARKAVRDPFFDYYSQFFTEYLPSTKDSSPNTIASYRSAFRLIEDYYVNSTGRPFATMTMATLSVAFVEGFMGWLKDARNSSPATVGVRLAAVRSFLWFCTSRDALYTALCNAVASIPTPSVPDRGLVYLSHEALKAIFAQPDPDRTKGLRDLTFMVLMYESAARMQEMLSLRICDIRTDDGILCLWLTGKGRKRRVIPLGVKASRHLARYLETFHKGAGINSDALLFYTVIHGQRCSMSADCADLFIKKYAAAARVYCVDVPQKMHSHLFRHSRAMHLYQAGNDLITVRDFLGHTSIATTDIYARADTKMLADAISKVSPSGEHKDKDWEDAEIAGQIKDYLRLHGFV